MGHCLNITFVFPRYALQNKGAVLKRVLWIMDVSFKYTDFGWISLFRGDFFIESVSPFLQYSSSLSLQSSQLPRTRPVPYNTFSCTVYLSTSCGKEDRQSILLETFQATIITQVHGHLCAISLTNMTQFKLNFMIGTETVLNKVIPSQPCV